MAKRELPLLVEEFLGLLSVQLQLGPVHPPEVFRVLQELEQTFDLGWPSFTR